MTAEKSRKPAPGRSLPLALLAVWSVTGPVGAGAADSLDHGHSQWTGVLKRYVRNGDVDYQGLASEGRGPFDLYLRSLQAASASEHTFGRDERMAFWINAYNAFTIRLVLDNYPIESIRSVGLLPGAPFRARESDVVSGSSGERRAAGPRRGAREVTPQGCMRRSRRRTARIRVPDRAQGLVLTCFSRGKTFSSQ